MYSYVRDELPQLIGANFPVDIERQSIFGHSMGGHGALTIALKNPDRFKSVSAFAPIAAPSRCPWGQKAFKGYLGTDESAWEDYDASRLVARNLTQKIPLLVDQGGADQFLQEQLYPQALQAACRETRHPLELRLRAGFDHGYYYISTYMEEHLRYHAQALNV
jgi:S-formylglutathione hydrolase